MELDNFDDDESLKKVQVFYSNETAKTVKLEYANCQDEQCKRYGDFEVVDTQ